MSEGISKKLQKLDDFLISDVVSDDAMLLCELDGFLAAVIICPDMILPSEWMPCIWGEESPEFESEQQAQTIIGLIMEHYNDIARELDQGRFSPIYDIDFDDDIFWEFWIEGYWKAVRLRPDAWQAFAENNDADIQRALFVLGRLGELSTYSPDELDPMEIDEQLKDLASDLIPVHVEILHQARRAAASPFAAPANENRPKVGRNDPCPCGSGKKFKKCCLN